MFTVPSTIEDRVLKLFDRAIKTLLISRFTFSTKYCSKGIDR